MFFAVMEFIIEAFQPSLIILILICGLWSTFMLGKALDEQKLKMESKIAVWGGKIYIASAILIYVLEKIYPIVISFSY
jgi:hypothetical protein